jgi:hypothetical protein
VVVATGAAAAGHAILAMNASATAVIAILISRPSKLVLKIGKMLKRKKIAVVNGLLFY